jgi:hypothetical protein
LKKHEPIEPGDVCEIIDIHPVNAFHSKKKNFIGKKVAVEKVYNERSGDAWLDVDVVLLEDAYPLKKGREVPLYKAKLKKLVIN